MSLAHQVFNENVVLGLKSIRANHYIIHFLEMSNYVQIILMWWIVNVKSPGKRRRLNNIFMNPLSDKSIQYLSPKKKRLRLENEHLLAAIEESEKENIARVRDISFSSARCFIWMVIGPLFRSKTV